MLSKEDIEEMIEEMNDILVRYKELSEKTGESFERAITSIECDVELLQDVLVGLKSARLFMWEYLLSEYKNDYL